jgi:hypothetical protein
MNTSRKTLVCLLLAVLLLMVGVTAPAAADSSLPENKVPDPVEKTAHDLVEDLEHQGYEVARGYFKLYTQADCPYSYAVIHTCLGNNPAAPYVLPIVPPWPDEWVDPGTAGMVGPTLEGYNGSYRLDPREAIVIFGVLPPPARYFGLQTYLVSRPGKWKENSGQYKFVQENIPALVDTFFTKLPKNPERLQLWADLSDPINNVVIENGSSAVWNQVRYFVITPDKTMDDAVRHALAGLDIPDQKVFTEQIPSKLGVTNVRVGLDEGADDFLTALRYAMPDDGGDDDDDGSIAWRHDLPLVVLRIRDPRPAHRPKPTNPPVEFETRFGATPPETDLKPNLIMLAGAICSKWNQQPCDPKPLLNMKASPLKWTGPECVKVGMNCLAPNEDAAYFMSARLPLPDDQVVYAAIGALGTRTGNATYVGLGLNSSLTQLGFANIDDDKLAGTANEYKAVPNHESFFLQYFARDCTGKKLAALTDGSPCYSIGDQLPDCPNPADLTCAELVLSLRDYLRPGSQRGPAPELTLNPLVIPLQRPQETE